ncbi:hypothetical protein BGZ51_001279, partial [Haplosporangium sp. Z 767]
STALGIRDRHSLDDTENSGPEDPGRSTRSIQVGQQGDMHSASALVIHRQGHCHDSSRLPSTAQGPTLAGNQDPSAEIGLILGGLDLTNTSSNRGASLVAHSPATMERTFMDCVQSTDGHLYRRIQLRMGHCYQQPIIQRNLDTTTTTPPHQLQGAVDCFHCLEAARGQGTNGEHYFRQHHHNRLHQPLRRNEITRVDETCDHVMEL